MAHSVLYADLRFAKGPWGCGTASGALGEAPNMDEADSPYENVAPGPAPAGPAGEGTRHSPGRCSRRRCIPAGLLAASLLLLVALVALGTCYWQATRELRDTSLEQAAERGRFSQEARAWEQSLEQARRELAQARAELQRAWREGNSTVPPSPDCCPPGWLLYHGKCLFVSSEKKSWWQSWSDCEARSSQLLVHGERQAWALPVRGGCAGEGVSPLPAQLGKYKWPFECALVGSGKVERTSCYWAQHWICEQPPKLSNLSEIFSPLLAGG
uniref:Uncharacterized protein n=1 Tax=Anser cygnoides TaxID=8845 RepID=A0A8B9EGU8_ANSCY